MPLRWRVNPLALLKEKGYPSTRIRAEKIMAQSTLTKLRAGGPVSWHDFETICRLTGKSPGKLIEFVKDEKE